MTADMIRALREERETLVARGLDDRVAQVDAQLAHYGDEEAAGRLRAAAGTDRSDAPERATRAPRARR